MPFGHNQMFSVFLHADRNLAEHLRLGLKAFDFRLNVPFFVYKKDSFSW